MVTSNSSESIVALHKAVDDGNKHRVTQIIADHGPGLCNQLLYGFTAMHKAVQTPPLLQILLSKGGNADATAGRGLDLPCPSGATPLHLAAYTGNSDAVQLLLQAQADVNHQDSLGRTPLHYAAMEGRLKVAEMLCKAKSDFNLQNSVGRHPLQEAIVFNQFKLAVYLLNIGSSVYSFDHQHRTALHFAAQMGHSPFVTRLINLGAVVDAKTKRGYTPLMVCVSYSQMEPAKVLLEHQASASAVNSDGQGLMHIAAAKGASLEMMEWAMSVTNIPCMERFDKEGRSAIHIMAAKASSVESLQLLVDYGVNVNLADENGRTPLHVAAMEANYLSVAVLLQLGGDSELCDDKGCFPIDYARETEMKGVFKKYARKRKVAGEMAEIDKDDMNKFIKRSRSLSDGHCNPHMSGDPVRSRAYLHRRDSKSNTQNQLAENQPAQPKVKSEQTNGNCDAFKNRRMSNDDINQSQDHDMAHMELSQLHEEVSFILQEGETALRQSVEEEVKDLQRDLNQLYQHANDAVAGTE